MSIATDEAEKKYPRDVALTVASENNVCRRTGYVAGRTAEPTFAEADELVGDLLVLGISLKLDDAMKILRNLRKVVAES